jgi:hypothetical protein
MNLTSGKVFDRLRHRFLNGRSRAGDPRRFDSEFSLRHQTAAIRRAEEKREHRARVRRLHSA